MKIKKNILNAKYKQLCLIVVVLSTIIQNVCPHLDQFAHYKLCSETMPNKINVHVIAHSHDDVGWLKTVNQYFENDVQQIIDNVLDALEANPARRFIQVETAFLWRWWNARNKHHRKRMVDLVNAGRLEFIGGGISMADEAGTHYTDLIDEMTWGFRFLNDTFGPIAVPKVAWQIDPFGHSREAASLFAQMGFDGLVLGRIDHQDRDQRRQKSTMEFIWNASANIDSHIFTTVLYDHYTTPKFISYHMWSYSTAPSIKTYLKENVENSFNNWVNETWKAFKTNHLMLVIGDDFAFEHAATLFGLMDETINLINDESQSVYVLYSTPSCYLWALNKQSSGTWTVESNDFMPYATGDDTYWTGYFTSRPTFKGLVKYTSNILRAAKQLATYADLGETGHKNIQDLALAQGEVQHHDAVTGTAQQHVNNDYILNLAKGLTSAMIAINNAMSIILPKVHKLMEEHKLCPYLNISFCEHTQDAPKFVVTVYNPLGHPVTANVRVPVDRYPYLVSGPDGQPIQSQLVDIPWVIINNPSRLIKNPFKVSKDLVFSSLIPPHGFTSFFVESTETANNSLNNGYSKNWSTGDLSIQNEFLLVTVDGESGLLKSITDLNEYKKYNVGQNFYYYSENEMNKSHSGAYIFRPNKSAEVLATKAISNLINGTLVQEIHQLFSDHASQIIRLYPGENKVELEWIVGPFDIINDYGHEIVTVYSTDFNNEGIFYTDSNGREILQRKRNYRPTWDIQMTNNISGNYYPVTSRIYIQDVGTNSQLTVLTDRSEGGGSIEDGSIELMLHRCLPLDDNFGVSEPLNEKDVDGHGLRVRGKHWLLVSSITNGAKLHRAAALAVANPPVIFIAPLFTSVSEYIDQFYTNFSGLSQPLPSNVHLLTLEWWKSGALLLRLEHIYEATDDPDGLSNPVTINIKDLFEFEINSLAETTLGANIWLQNNKRLQWKTYPTLKRTFKSRHDEKNFNIVLFPMQIRTFIVYY